MKKFLKLIIIVGLFAVGYHFRFEINQALAPYVENIKERLHLTAAPCTEPIPYRLDNFDTKFGISKEYFLSALVDAEAVWEKPYGKELFTYAPDSTSSSDLKVNLVYDYRQEATSKLSSLGITVKDSRDSYNSLKAKFDSVKAEFESEQATYNNDVNAFNHTDHTNEAEFNRLEAERKHLNNKADEVNALVVALNRLIGTLNLSVEKYNTTNVSRGESFEEGVYIQNGSDREIDVYEFSSRGKLIRVLAHELGHSLGLDHVDDPNAIMYSLNQGTNATLTEADLAALKAKCQTK